MRLLDNTVLLEKICNTIASSPVSTEMQLKILSPQAYQQTYWHSMVPIQQVYPQPCGEPQFQPYPGSSVSASPDHTVPQPYLESARSCPPPQGETPSNGQHLTASTTSTSLHTHSWCHQHRTHHSLSPMPSVSS